ncbi:MAG: hypothetical protein ACP5QB_13495, partial [Thiomonas sp.]
MKIEIEIKFKKYTIVCIRIFSVDDKFISSFFTVHNQSGACVGSFSTLEEAEGFIESELHINNSDHSHQPSDVPPDEVAPANPLHP